MKKVLFLHIAILGFYLCSIARPVDQETAQNIAAKFMETSNLQLAATYRTERGASAFHVFNTADGFVIVSADDCETPIIGYSREGRFDPNNVPIQMEGYLQDFIARIQYGIENHIEADEATAKQWEMVKTTGKLNDSKSTKAVAPLLTDKWNQGCLYNSLCPTMSGPCGHAEVGCVAVAMAQIMRYWGYPTTGWGTHSYSNAGLTLSADFGNTTYDWEHMPDSLTENSSETEIEAVATLLYHCGISVEMNYSPNGSNSNSSKIPDALIRYFYYSKHIHREKRSDFSNEEWLSLLKSSLDLQRPVQYSGFGVGIGHAFVCDGYDENDLLHFNWGWGGNANGYFALGNLYPNGNNLNNNNYAIFDIIPQYEPYVVEASSIPSAAGVIEGNGEYHRGETCTLTATPIANSKFLFWKKADQILSQDLSYSFDVLADVDDIEAHFSLPEVKQITACYAPDPNDPNSSFVSLSWSLDDSEWAFLKQFNLNGEHGLATDEEYYYACKFDNHSSASPIFGKYTLDGELVELFDIEGAYPKSITCDGDYFYCSNNRGLGTFYLYKYDLSQKTLIDSTHMHMQFDLCAYDAENDGFWLYDKFMGRKLTLKNRQGETLIAGLTLSSYPNTSICGIGKIIAKDEEPHLLILIDSGNIRDYDIHNNVLYTHPSISTNQGEIFVGATIGKYNGKDAMFAVVGDYFYNNTAVRIYEINSHLSHVIGYRLYRSDSNGDIVMLADDVVEAPYIDSTWNTINEGIYRFGISEVYANGNASDIIWSEPIENNGVGFEEHKEDPSEFPVQKVLENGQIVIIKDGKRYTITGQQLN
jgi:hypothetical protein